MNPHSNTLKFNEVITIKKVITSLLFVFVTTGCLVQKTTGTGINKKAVEAETETSTRERVSFNEGWLFARFGDMPDGSERAEPSGLENPELDDSGWRKLNLPHDWGIEGPFREDLPNVTAKLPWPGIGWYRKHFEVSTEDKGRRIFIDFDGAMSQARVWINGQYLGEWPYGYNSFRFEISSHLRFGEKNVIAVRLDNPPQSSRWYPGGGIYRNTWLEKTGPVHIDHWGVFVNTPFVSSNRAQVEVNTDVVNVTDSGANLTVRHQVFPENDPGRIVATAEQYGIVAEAGKSAKSLVHFDVSNPELWDIESPHMYVLRTSIMEGGRLLDSKDTPFGIRSVVYDVQKGLLLNGRQVPVNGVNQHHDLGALGAAVNKRAIERQLELLREMGTNAIRTAHNPPAPELLELTDRMGFLVVNELFDAWKYQARAWVPNDYARHFPDWHERDVRAFVRRDRNHPSVIIWSSGNEVREQREPDGVETAIKLKRLFHEEDPTRPVVGSLDHPYAVQAGFHRGFDIIGIAYKPHLYANTRLLVPDKPVIGLETSSTMSSRGEYFFPVSEGPPISFLNAFTPIMDEDQRMEDMETLTAAALEDMGAEGIDLEIDRTARRRLSAFHPVMARLYEGADIFQVGSFDLFHPPWGSTPDIEFAGQDANTFVLGEFVWTGFDYLGEPNPFDSGRYRGYNHSDDIERITAAMERNNGFIPSRSSYFGIFDLAGFRKDRFYLYQARWRPDYPMAHILPHWNWPERKGEVTPVHVYTSGDEAELFLNNRSLGRKKRGGKEYRLMWNDVRYEPGELRVVAYKDGEKWAESVRRTTGSATGLSLSPDRSELAADGSDLSFITVSIRDKNGDIVPRTSNKVSFQIKGPGEIIAVDNGDATRLESFQATEIEAFNGKCLVIIRTKKDQTGLIELKAEAEGLQAAVVTLRSVPSSPNP